MDAARMSEIMAYCRIDEADVSPADKVLLNGMLHSAVAYLEQAGVPVPESGTARRAQYDHVVNALILDSWENRGSQAVAVTVMENPALKRQVVQLKLSGLVPAVPDSGTAGL